MRALCIARHRYLSEHVSSIFRDLGIVTMPAVGFLDGMAAARAVRPDFVACDLDLLAMAPRQEWLADGQLAAIPIIAVSLNRRPDDDGVLLDGAGLAGFLYLPTLLPEQVRDAVHAATGQCVRAPAHAFRWSDGESQRHTAHG